MSHILSSANNHVLTLSLQRPSSKNALSLQMYQQLTDELISFEDNPDLSVVVLKGDEHCFTAGNDLKDFLSSGQLDQDHPTVKFLHKVNTLKKPIVAAVSGPAIGIGTTLLLHCDYVLATDTSRFQLPFCHLGVCPELASSELLPKLVGHQKAFELLVLGEPFSAEQALDYGVINKIVNVESLITEASTIANRIARLPQGSVLATKRLLKRNTNTGLTIDAELVEFQSLLDSTETQAVISNFFNKK